MQIQTEVLEPAQPERAEEAQELQPDKPESKDEIIDAQMEEITNTLEGSGNRNPQLMVGRCLPSVLSWQEAPQPQRKLPTSRLKQLNPTQLAPRYDFASSESSQIVLARGLSLFPLWSIPVVESPLFEVLLCTARSHKTLLVPLGALRCHRLHLRQMVTAIS